MVHKCFLINPVWFISILISLEVIIRVNIQLILESPIPRSTNHRWSELGSGQPNRRYQQNNLTAAPCVHCILAGLNSNIEYLVDAGIYQTFVYL